MKSQHTSRIGWLMLFSQLLLIAFVTQWLFAQYKDEKELLRKDLTQQLNNSRQQLMDSLIVVNIIDPIFHDNKPYQARLEISDTITDKNVFKRRIFNDSLTLIDRRVRPSFNKTQEEIDQMITIGPDKDVRKKDLLVHGVKMFVKKIEANDNKEDTMHNSFFVMKDTLLFKKIVSGNFSKAGYSFPLEWSSAKDSLPKKMHGLYLESNILSKEFGVEINNYQVYLFKKISPQFLFGFILLCLTGAAFLIAYRSLKNQMRLNVLKNDFISNITHELKTPVSTVKVAIEALQDFDMKQDDKKSSEYLGMAAQEINRLELLINKVLNTSALEDNKKLIHTEKTNLKPLIDDVIKSMQPRFDQQKANVKFEYLDHEMYAHVDKLHIQGVLINLLDNSLKYGNENPAISVTLAQYNGIIYISVADNGPGIPVEYIEKVFDKFFRVPSGNLHNVKGYGLGLCYAAMIMKQHDGEITVENLKEGGCRFTITFPYKKP